MEYVYRMRRGISPRDTKRLMKRMGISMDAIPNIKQVIFKTEFKNIIVDDPEVAVLNLKGQKVFQVSGKISEVAIEVEEEMKIPEEDIKLVADQTGRTFEEAKQALKQSGGDLAKAILFLKH